MEQEVPMTSASLTPPAANHEPVLADNPSVEPGDVNKEHILAGARASSKRTSLKSSSRTAWKISKNPTDSRTLMSSPQVKSQASPSAQHLYTRSYSKQSLRSKTPSAWRHLTREGEEARDVSGAKEPAVGQHQSGRTGSLLHLAKSTQKEADSVQAYSDGKEPAAGQHRPLRPRVPGSPQKTTKTSHKEAREYRNGLSAKESLASIGQDVKAEGKLFQEKKNSIIPINIKHKFGSSIVDELVTEEQARRALCEAGLIEGQKRLSNRSSKTPENPMATTPFADYYELGYNLRSNIFQGEEPSISTLRSPCTICIAPGLLHCSLCLFNYNSPSPFSSSSSRPSCSEHSRSRIPRERRDGYGSPFYPFPLFLIFLSSFFPTSNSEV
ncbi:ciliary microtubule inner protein 4 isoform 2-T2 [Pangshura tecta]